MNKLWEGIKHLFTFFSKVSEDTEQEKTIRDLKQKLEDTKKELDDFVVSFDSFVKEKDDKINELNKELLKAKAEAESYKKFWESKKRNDAIVISLFSDEKELFPGEITSWLKGELFLILKQKLEREDASRIKHVAKEILEKNPELDFNLSDSFKKYKEEEDLISLEYKSSSSFVKIGEEKHKKYAYHNDMRYIITFSKTPGDRKSNKNLTSCFKNLCELKPGK